MAKLELEFRTNVGIKDIIGRGLILDDNIAIIELIKNSKDASSSEVSVLFSDLENLSKSEIVIADRGKGMDVDSIRNKWLNIAYSEKKNARDRNDKAYAGNKGVGRFSCDRLGKNLILYTKSKDGDYIKLPIDWTKFEINESNADISSVKLEYQLLSKDQFLNEVGIPDLKTGTVLKISELRSNWNSAKINKLRSELEKFVSAPDAAFKVYLGVNSSPKKQIVNTVFDELLLRTYNIRSWIDAEGKEITTSLYYHGEIIYEYIAENPFKELKNINLSVHYLNFTAKSFFKRRTGYSTNDYGSIFLFLNDFRVFPYGNPKNDWLGLDQRKSQGTARYLGTREVIGQVNIEDHDDIFIPVTSREGMVQNKAFFELMGYDKSMTEDTDQEYGYVPQIIRQLEKVVVDGLKWHSLIDLHNPDGDKAKIISEADLKKDPTRYALRPIDPKNFNEVVEKTIKNSNLIIKTFSINTKLIARLSKEAEDSYNEFILSFIANSTGKALEDLDPKDQGALRRIAEENMRALRSEKDALKRADQDRRRAEEAEKRAKEEAKRAEDAEKRAAIEATKAAKAEQNASDAAHALKKAKDENLFLQSDANKDSDHLINLHHQIVLYCSTAESGIENLKNLLRDSKSSISESALEFATSIEKSLTKILKVSSFATNQKYKLALNSIEGNLVQFVSNYLDEAIEQKLMPKRISVINKIDDNRVFKSKFSPMDIMILVDNLISNAKRAGATEITFAAAESKVGLFLIADNGSGLDASITNPKDVFLKGFTTTSGSGRGLFHVAETLKSLKLSISITSNPIYSKGLCLEVSHAN